MKAKKYIVAGMVLNTVLVGFAISFSHHRTSGTPPSNVGLAQTALTGDPGKFGPIIETVVPGSSDGSAQILDLETGRVMPHPAMDDADSRADTIMNWIRSNGLDLSCTVWRGGAACITHDMAIVSAEGKWEKTGEQEILANPALTLTGHSPRRLLMLSANHPNTYLFRTAEGTVGILQMLGWNQADGGVKIRYKLINPAGSFAARQTATKLPL